MARHLKVVVVPPTPKGRYAHGLPDKTFCEVVYPNSPFSILHSPFSILHSPFSILHSPFMAKDKILVDAKTYKLMQEELAALKTRVAEFEEAATLPQATQVA
ncbi:MAG: hypothetical protein F6J86_00290, partial [Symploca sp. SIO1B1]|nr:hypothetical protein [Symploca sp. SIO1B1]